MKAHLLFFFLLISCSLNAQLDSIFWFAAPEVSQHNGPFDEDIIINLTSISNPTTVTVDKPADPTFSPIIISLAPNSTQEINLTNWKNELENKPENTILNYGLRIQSNEPILAYYEVRSNYCNCNPEIFSLKGQNAMGNNFFIPGQNYLDNYYDFSPDPYNSFDIIATEDDTEIIIIPSNNASGINAGDTVTINLNMGQTYSVRAQSQNAEFHLGGSEVYSDKPISITMKDDLLAGFPFLSTCKDLGGDQIVPIERLGSDYILINSFLDGPGDQAFILAIENNTVLYANNNQIATLNKGEIHQISMGNANSMFVQADKPITVLQMSGNGCEVGLAQLPHIECTGSQNISLTRSTDELFVVNLIVPTEGIGSFIVNGNSNLLNTSDFEFVEGTNEEWSFIQASFNNQILPIGSVLNIENSDYLFHSSVIHGGTTTGTRFAYFSDFSSIIQEFGVLDKYYCPGSNLEYIIDSIPGAEYNWTGPNSFTSTSSNLFIEDLETMDQGIYEVNISLQNCNDISKEIEVNLIDNINIELPQDTSLCVGLNHIISPSYVENEIDYSWTDASNTITEDFNLDITSFNESDTGLYILQGVHPNCPVIPDSIILSIDSSYYAEAFISSPFICEDGTVEIAVTNGYSNPTWFGPNNFEINANSFVINDIQISDAGVYYFIDNDSECGEISDSVELEVVNIINLEINLAEDSLCVGEDLVLNALPSNQGYELQWLGPNGFSSTEENPILTQIDLENQGTYILSGQSNECNLLPDSVFISVLSDTSLNAIYPDTICELAPFIIDADLNLNANYSISWGTDNTLSSSSLPINLPAIDSSGYIMFNLNAENWVCPVEGDSFTIYLDPIIDLSPEISQDSTCVGQTIDLQANYYDNLNYFWTGPNGFESNSQNPSLVDVDLENSGYYLLTVDGDYCIGPADSNYLYVLPPLDPEIIIDQDSLCVGEQLYLSAEGLSGISYNWTGPANQVYENNIIDISSVNEFDSGIYTLNINNYPCPSPELTIPVYVEANPLIIINDSICNNYYYELPNNDIVDFPGTYYLNETTALGCLQQMEINLSPKNCESCLFIPNVFSPDYNGLNDLWAPIVRCPIVSYQCKVFDRWGSLVFESNEIEHKWDGKINGQDAGPSVYVWHCNILFEGQIRATDLKGSLSLIR